MDAIEEEKEELVADDFIDFSFFYFIHSKKREREIDVPGARRCRTIMLGLE